MRKPLMLSLCLLLALSCLSTSTIAKENPKERTSPIRIMSSPERAVLPQDLMNSFSRASLSAAAVDTIVLARYDFDTNGIADPQGWTTFDETVARGTFFHVADISELDGGSFGTLLPLEGSQSLWCGVAPTTADPFCGYATLPGYGNSWDQVFESKTFACDSLRLYYKVRWDSEPGYDHTDVRYFDAAAQMWERLPVNDGRFNGYDQSGQLDECFSIAAPAGSTSIQFNFWSDGAFSDEDGLWPTDGAIIVDSITVLCYNGGVVTDSLYEDFEDETPGALATNDGCWAAYSWPVGYGDFGALHPGALVVQEDPCLNNLSNFWGFFDDPAVTNYACGGFPNQGAVPYVNADGQYIQNAIYSPKIPFVGDGEEVWLKFRVYRDLALDALIFYRWGVKSFISGCSTSRGFWRSENLVRWGDQKDWHQDSFALESYLDPGAEEIQVRLAVVDMCGVWCNVFGTGACHSHAPLFDDVEILRVNPNGPRMQVLHMNLFQDNFAEDGTTGGTARADIANDIAPVSSPAILPGDSIAITVTDMSHGLATDPIGGVGPALYAYVALWPQGQSGKTGPDMQAPETRAGIGQRYPLVDSLSHDGAMWYCLRMDSAFIAPGAPVADRFCFDLNDAVFTPGDTICYVFCAQNAIGEKTYFSRRLDGQGQNFVTNDTWEALDSPMEFTILPASGWKRGGEILYVDDADDRGGPVQLYFDSAFDALNIRGLVDRYDVLSPSSTVGNSLASRVKNLFAQIIACYKTIIWSSGNLSEGLVGDGSGDPEKSDDFALLYQLLDIHPNLPGIYITGNNIAEEWVTLTGSSAINLRTVFMNFNLVSGDHVSHGEAVSPLLVASGPCFIHLGDPDSLIVSGGCPLIDNFDVLQPTGLSVTEFPYPNSGDGAVISQTTPNSAGSTAQVILSGFSFDKIHDMRPGFPVARFEHLRDILIWLQVGPIPLPVGIDNTAQLTNRLHNNYPNPFNPTTTIAYSIGAQSHVSLRVYNVAGQLVRTLVDEVQSPRAEGFSVTWDGRSNNGEPISSGVYFYRIAAKDFAQTKKMVLLK